MQLRVGIFRLSIQNQTPISLKDVIAQISSSPLDKKLTLSADEPIRPRKLEICSEYCLGDFTKIRRVDEMHLTDLSGNEETMRFGPNSKRPSEFTAFLFDSTSSCLFVHEHQYGITHASIGRYFQLATGAHRLQFQPVLRIGTDDWLEKQHHFSRIKIVLAGIENADFLRDQGLGTNRILGLLNAYQAPTVWIDLRMGKSDDDRGGLSEVKSTVKALLPFTGRGGKVKQLIVSGSESREAEEFPVNFIKDRLTFHWDVECSRGSLPSDADRYRAVTEAWTKFGQELRRRFAASSNH